MSTFVISRRQLHISLGGIWERIFSFTNSRVFQAFGTYSAENGKFVALNNVVTDEITTAVTNDFNLPSNTIEGFNALSSVLNTQRIEFNCGESVNRFNDPFVP